MESAKHGDLRRYPRRPLRVWIDCRFHPKGDRSRAYAYQSVAEDLGTTGLSMRINRPLSPGQVITLTLYLPPQPEPTVWGQRPPAFDEDYFPATILSRVMWCQRLDEQNFRVGIQFLHLDPQDRHRFKTFLVDHQLDSEESPLYV